MGECLEKRCIASWRKEILSAKTVQLNEMWEQAATVDGISERGSFRTELRREIIAQLLANIVSLYCGCAFGSWARTRHNGKLWRDLDISLPYLHISLNQEVPIYNKIEDFVNCAVEYICQSINSLDDTMICVREIGVDQRKVDQTEVDQTEVYQPKIWPDSSYRIMTYVFSVLLSEGSFDVRCDIASIIPECFTPVTVGSCLTWSKKWGFKLRDFPNGRINRFTIEKILKFLEDGKDIKIVENYTNNSKKELYAKYYWKRIKLMEMDKIELNWYPQYGHSREPIEPNKSELDELLKSVSTLRIG
tara:strand:- start:172 stop:1083 length:912 start_codon:yes stop_codon:yes gene_type:complete